MYGCFAEKLGNRIKIYIFFDLIILLNFILQEHVNEIDFDYIGYAKQRFDQYWLTKPELLGSSGATTNALPDGNYNI